VPSQPRVVVVTGASAGVGRATARAFAARGDTVALLARGQDGLDGAAQDVRRAGGRPLPIVCDVSDAEAVEAAAAQVEREAGPIDVWVNNAMAAVFSPLTEMTAEEFARTTAVTYLGSVHGTMAALRRMLPRDSGTIVQVGSALAYRGIPLQSAYCGAKHALRGFYDSVRSELVHDGSRVWVAEVHMPGMNTPQFRLGRSHMPRKAQPVAPIFQPEIAARAVVYASEHRRRAMWVGTSTVGTVIAGVLAPRLMDLFLGRTNYQGQQIDEPEDPDRPDYLFAPVPGDHGAHGPYDDKAHAVSPQLTLSTHRPAVAAVGVALMAVAAATRAMWNGRH
jgi:NAD(P)-dependent dehydrogenase (short-subunit alcohol dehydrogenase family)